MYMPAEGNATRTFLFAIEITSKYDRIQLVDKTVDNPVYK